MYDEHKPTFSQPDTWWLPNRRGNIFHTATVSECYTLRLGPARVSMININPDLGLTKVAQQAKRATTIQKSFTYETRPWYLKSLDKHNWQSIRQKAFLCGSLVSVVCKPKKRANSFFLLQSNKSTWTGADASGLLSAQTREKGFSLNISQSSSCASPSQPVTNATRVTVGCKLRFSTTWRRWDMGERWDGGGVTRIRRDMEEVGHRRGATWGRNHKDKAWHGGGGARHSPIGEPQVHCHCWLSKMSQNFVAYSMPEN